MLVTAKALLWGAIALPSVLAFDMNYQGGRCNRDIMNGDTHLIGGGDGMDFCEQRSDYGVVINGIEVWADKDGVNGLRVRFTDGSNSPQLGRQLGDHKEASWKPDEGDLLSNIDLWGNGNGRHVGRIRLRFSSGYVFEHGKDVNGKNPFELNVGGGIMLGIAGLHSPDKVINQLTFRMLKSNIKSTEIGDLHYEEDTDAIIAQKKGIEGRIISEAHFQNNQTNGNYMDYKIEQRWSTSSKSQWSLTQTHTIGGKYTYKSSAKVLDVGVEHSFELSYSYANAAMEGGEKAEDDIRVSSASGKLDPGEEVWCRAIAQRGAYDGAFSTKIILHLDDGTTWEYDAEGKSSSIKYAQFTTTCQSERFTKEFDQAPENEVKLLEDKSTQPTKREARRLATPFSA
ncbi:hypothetical protein BDV95DRAFT_609112 [Massariosphaeria phaeospora]|uniref:Jacalin-type lectin domain-containing protein n=1 Tax=Massariosphaeria phaeospora TaxID=100035 RepID=A0A7C8I327_9PLEO|nr:hypothetical protein BDV95DRAFT_609112 [Massariosphaeria phaeospora]